jgi:hypothetical protein
VIVREFHGEGFALDSIRFWSLNAVASKGTAQIKLPNGMTVNMPTPQVKASVSTMDYTCSGNSVSTVQSMPRNTTMATTYSRVQ